MGGKGSYLAGGWGLGQGLEGSEKGQGLGSLADLQTFPILSALESLPESLENRSPESH